MIELNKISYSVTDKFLFDKKSDNILSNISMKINHGDIIGIIGESGAGKTTLAKIVAGVVNPTSGDIIRSGIKENDIQILFQNNFELINPLRRIESILNDAKYLSNNAEEINYYLKKIGLSNSILQKFGNQLSGGERQRIALARILMVSPKLLVLDEPFSAQDPESQLELVKLFQFLNTDMDLTILCVSHDLNIMSNFPTKLGVMQRGNIVEFGDTKDLVNNPKHKYTEFLFRAIKFELTIGDFNITK
jgi:ABC-type dipeptide/oligopeptide/nickel transport system ATPase subunit